MNVACKIYHDGRLMLAKEWAEELGIVKQTVITRHHRGIPINAHFPITKRRIDEAVAVCQRIKASAKTRIKIYKVFSQYLKKMKYREIRNAYQIELTKAA